MKFLNWTNIRLILMFTLVIFLYSFTANRNLHRKLLKSEVIFEGESNNFIKPETVNKLLIENVSDVKTIEKEEVNLRKVEKSIDNNPMIKKSEVYVSLDGVLRARVIQKTPIARVFMDEGSYYIDDEGKQMPLSTITTARVPLVTGAINARNEKKLSEILKMIFEDDFLKKNITGIQVLPNENLILNNRNFDYRIEFGKMVDEEKKFKNYKAFFQKAVIDSTLYNYKNVNLRFTKQVICTKKTMANVVQEIK